MVRERYDLTGKVAIVTGASRGIGKAIAAALAESGATVILTSRKAEHVEKAAQEIREQGGKAYTIACHMGHPEEIDRLVDEVIRRSGTVDVVVNNAAINPVITGLEFVEPALFEKMIQVNLYGPLRLAQRVFPYMARHKRGSIINMSSVYGLKPERGLGLYSITKAALIMQTKALAREWGDHGIRINAICPGLIRTRFSAALWQDPEVQARIEGELPLHRIGEPEDVAGLALFLASDAAAYCTGGVYLVDGGEMLL